MVVEGVDYSFARPGGTALVAAGKHFACRYLEYSHAPAGAVGKFLTADELADLRSHGLAVVACFESTSTRALSGRAAGIADGTDARVAMSGLGFPPDAPVYFAVDFDASAAQQDAIDAYLGGCAVALGVSRVGVYAGIGPVERCAANHSASWFWQTYAWSGGKVSPHAHLYQWRNGQNLNGAVDFTRALVPDYGQWPPLGLPPTDTEDGMNPLDPQGYTPAVADFTPGATLYDDAARTKVHATGWAGGQTVGVVAIDTANAHKFSAPNVTINIQGAVAGTREIVVVGADHMQNLRVRPGYFAQALIPIPPPPPELPTKTLTVTGQGLVVTGPK